MDQPLEPRKIDWMYAGASAHVDREEYLLGRSIDSSLRHFQEDDDKKCHTRDETLVNIPGALFEEKQHAVKLDHQAKLREDPLSIVRRQEELRRKALMANPYLVKQIMRKHNIGIASADLDRKIRGSTSRVADRRRHVNEEDRAKRRLPANDADGSAAELLRTLKSVGVSKLRELLRENDDSESSSSSDAESDKNGLRRAGKTQNRREHDDDGRGDSKRRRPAKGSVLPSKYSPRRERTGARRSPAALTSPVRTIRSNTGSSAETKASVHEGKRDKSSGFYSGSTRNHSKGRSDSVRQTRNPERSDAPSGSRQPLNTMSDDAATMQEKLDEMRRNATWRAELNTKRLSEAEKRNAEQQERDKVQAKEGKGFVQNMLTAAAGASSVEQRIRSNLNNVQRTRHALDQHFTRR